MCCYQVGMLQAYTSNPIGIKLDCKWNPIRIHMESILKPFGTEHGTNWNPIGNSQEPTSNPTRPNANPLGILQVTILSQHGIPQGSDNNPFGVPAINNLASTWHPTRNNWDTYRNPTRLEFE